VSQAYVIKFPHPGVEHNPGKLDRQEWNTGSHRRKFLHSLGSCIDGRGVRSHNTNLAFWGEWEAPSLIKQTWSRKGELPRFLHEPVWENPACDRPRQNTDPWVFGDRFRYSNCRQSDRLPGLMKLLPGSVIFFGSTVSRRFVVDTVFVVARSRLFTPEHPPNVEEAFLSCVIEPLMTTGRGACEFTLYDGATFENPFNGMFSFVPCRRLDLGDYRFERPALRLPRSYKPANTRQPYGTNRQLPLGQVFESWNNARRQVLDAKCLLGTQFQTPRRKAGVLSQVRPSLYSATMPRSKCITLCAKM
jgi:hypothetical protein